MMDVFFNILFLVLLVRFYGDRERDFYFNSGYKVVARFTDPVYQFASKLFSSPLGVHLFFFVLFIFIRTLHYYSYRADFMGLPWGPVILVWPFPTVFFSFFKAIFATLLFYYHFLIILLFFDWMTRRQSGGDPLWRMAKSLTQWPKELFRRISLFWVLIATILLFSLWFYVLLIPFGGKVVLVPGGSDPVSLFFKVILLNLFLAARIFKILFVLLLARVVISWVFPYGVAFVGDLVFRLTDPICAWFSRLNLRVGPIDFSVLLASFLCLFLDQVVRSLLIRLYLLL